jgi:hypothetical protein
MYVGGFNLNTISFPLDNPSNLTTISNNQNAVSLVFDNNNNLFSGYDTSANILKTSSTITFNPATIDISGSSIPIDLYNTTNSTIYDTFNLNVNLACFKEDTKILTDKGYRCIQDLRKGDLIKIANDEYKPIFMIGYSKIYNSDDNLRSKER